MKKLIGGLHKFVHRIHPEVVESVMRWRHHPELDSLLTSLEGHTKSKTFFDAFAEAMVARHLLARGCDLRFEVETPAGKCCDFEVARDGQCFYLHVKRLETGRLMRRNLTISSRLRVLERINRPFIVGVRWRVDLSAQRMQRFVTDASSFITQAHVGDEHVVLDEHGRELGGVRIVAPWDGPNVSLVIGLPSGFIDEAQRIAKLLGKAYSQFMPRAVNVMLICTSHEEDVADFESALLGQHIERWDTFPPRGRRIAHGRASDGFWKGASRADSSVAGWSRFVPAAREMQVRLWFREVAPVAAPMRGLLDDLFNDESESR